MDEHRFELVVSGGEDDAAPADVLDRWQAALDRRRRSGSYVELDEALAGLIHHVNKPVELRWVTEFAARAIGLLDELWLHGLRSLDELRVEELALVSAAEAYLDWRMPAVIRVPRDVRANDVEQRDHRRRVKGRAASNGAVRKRDVEIRSLIRRGVPTQRVAFDYGLSVSQVNRIVSGQTEDAA